MNVEEGISRFGKGLFSTMSFRPGNVISVISGSPMTFLDTIHLGEQECYPIQIGRDNYLYTDEPLCFINHSCEPNCGINDSQELVAIAAIEPGEELFFDYSTTMFERHWEMNCQCGTASCRGVIKDFDSLPPDVRTKYISLNVVPAFIIKEMNENATSVCEL